MALSAKELDRWRDRLRWANTCWADKGLDRESESAIMPKLLEMYRGKFDALSGQAFAQLPDEDRIRVNKIFSTANTIEGSIAARSPKVQYFPRTPRAKEFIRGAEALHNYDIQEQDHRRQFNRALHDAMAAPVGCVRHGFTPPEEFHGERSGRLMQSFPGARPATPWIRRVPIWNLRIDPDADTLDEAWWVGFRDVMWLDDIRENPNMVSREGLERLAGNVEKQRSRGRRGRIKRSPDSEDWIEVWTIYEKRERTWFQLVLDGLDKPLRDPDDWPLPWETLPLNLFGVNEQSDDALSVPILSQLVDQQVEMDRLRSLMSLMARSTRRLNIGNTNAFGHDKVESIVSGEPVEWYFVKGDPKQAVTSFQAASFPQELLSYAGLIEQDMREQVGQSLMGRGQRINVDTATEAANVQSGQNVSEARILDAFETFMSHAERLYIQGRRATLAETGDELVRVLGEAQAQTTEEWVTVTPEHLQQEYDLQIVVGSSRRRDQGEDERVAAARFQIAASVPNVFNVAHYARLLVEAQSQDPARALQPDAEEASRVAAADQTRRTATPGGEPAADSPAPGIDGNLLQALSGQVGSA